MATQPEIQGFISDLQQATASRIHSKKVALGVILPTTPNQMTIESIETDVGGSKLNLADAPTVAEDALVFIVGTGTSADGLWKVLTADSTEDQEHITIAAAFQYDAAGVAHDLATDAQWIKQAESVTQGDAAEDDEWGVIGLEDQKEYDDFTYEVTVNVYQDLPIEQIAVIMGIADPVNTKVNVENSNPVNLITCYYDGRTNASFMHSYTVQEKVYWKTNPKTISYGDYAMWEMTGEADASYSRKVFQETIV